MMRSPLRLLRIDELLRGDHAYLHADDEVYFLHEYTARGGITTESNRLILNLKKSPAKKGTREYRYKAPAIATCAEQLGKVMDPEWRRATIVPVPPSKTRSDPEYDDRLVQVLKLLNRNGNYDVREIVRQKKSTAAVHESDERLKPDELRALYEIDEGFTSPSPKHIVVFDDMITAGAHFAAMKAILHQRFGAVRITGLFISRRIVPPIPPDDEDEDS